MSAELRVGGQLAPSGIPSCMWGTKLDLLVSRSLDVFAEFSSLGSELSDPIVACCWPG